MVPKTSSGSGSSSRVGLAFEITPPTAARPGSPFTLPVIVGVRPVGNPTGSIEQLVMHASLRNESGATTASGLTGSLTSSVRSRNGNTTSGYARFSPLTIGQPGKYKLRVMLAASAGGVVTTTEYIESGVINVHGGAEAKQRPTATQVAKLQSLTTENIDISAADIAAWRA